MKILLIGRGLPSKQYPLNGIFEFDQAKALAEAGHQVIYISLDLRSFRRKRKWGIFSYERDGMTIMEVNVPCGNIPKKIEFFFGEMFLRKAVQRNINLNEVDIIHSHFPDISIISTNVFKNSNKKIFITEHSSEISMMKMSEKRYADIKAAYQRADVLIAVSKSLSAQIKKEFHVDSVCVNNIVDVKAFPFTETKENKNKYVFVVTGRLASGKKIDLLLSAFARLVLEDKNVFLYVIGDGAEKEKLKNLVITYKLQEYVEFCGSKSRNEIHDIYKKSHCFVLPSDSETFGVAYIEAIASGLPVIATKCGGPEDFVEKENGVLVEKDNVDELVTAMKAMKKNYGNFDRSKMSQNIVERFSPQQIAKKLTDLYERSL